MADPVRKRSRIVPPLWRIALLYVLYLAALFALQRRMLFPRAGQPLGGALDVGHRGALRLTLPVEGGVVEAWLMPGAGVSPARPGPAVIFAHGNGEIIDEWIDSLDFYRELGVTVLVPEYRGYGRSPGSPSQEALVGDFARFYDLLAARAEVDPKRIVIHGRSIGGGVACGLALQRRPAALVLQSTFASVDSLAWRYFAPPFLVRDHFDNESAVRQLDVPIFISHGDRDGLIPPAHAQRLVAAARRSTFLSVRCAHGDCPPPGDAFPRAIRDFLVSAGVVTQPAVVR